MGVSNTGNSATELQPVLVLLLSNSYVTLVQLHHLPNGNLKKHCLFHEIIILFKKDKAHVQYKALKTVKYYINIQCRYGFLVFHLHRDEGASRDTLTPSVLCFSRTHSWRVCGHVGVGYWDK